MRPRFPGWGYKRLFRARSQRQRSRSGHEGGLTSNSHDLLDQTTLLLLILCSEIAMLLAQVLQRPCCEYCSRLLHSQFDKFRFPLELSSFLRMVNSLSTVSLTHSIDVTYSFGHS